MPKTNTQECLACKAEEKYGGRSELHICGKDNTQTREEKQDVNTQQNPDAEEEKCDHKHFSPVCNSCETDMIITAIKQTLQAEVERLRTEKSKTKQACISNNLTSEFASEVRRETINDQIDHLQEVINGLNHPNE